MKNGRTKRFFLVALSVCFTLLVFLFARRSVDNQMALEREYPRNNDTLSLLYEEKKNGVIRIEGSGKLYANDLKALIVKAGIHTRNVNNIVLGEDITEIGNNAFANLKYLRTLKLGNGVTRAAPGALKNCAVLEWLYVPSSLQDIGGGFLYACDKCNVVTDARMEALPALENVSESERVYADVDSFQTLQVRVGKKTHLPDALALWW